MQYNIVLVGFMGSGKTTIGKRLAEHINFSFIDSDKQIMKRSGKSISDLFKISETCFRSWEETVLNEMKGLTNTVIATGGGIVVNKDNWSHLSDLGKVFFLKVSKETVTQRLRHDKKRPLLQQDNKDEIISNLLIEREPMYTNLSDYVVTVDNKSILEIINELLTIINYEKRYTS